jgi:hypothetical protein
MPDYNEHGNGDQLVVNLSGSGWSQHIACCDCGLDHLFIFEKGKKDTVIITVYRDDRRTTDLRKGSKFRCRPR